MADKCPECGYPLGEIYRPSTFANMPVKHTARPPHPDTMAGK